MNERVEQIRQRLAAATPGPWGNTSGQLAERMYESADVELITHAPEDIAYLLDRLHTAEAEAAGLREEKWVPVAFKPSAQPDGSEVSAPVLVYAPDLPTPTKVTKAMYCHDTGVWEHCLSPMALHVTHWQPLPAAPLPPQEKKGGEGV